MTDSTYFARIGNEADVKLANTLLNCPGTVAVDTFLIWDGHKFTNSFCPPVWGRYNPETTISDMVSRVVPLSVIGSLAECHGATLLPNVKDLSHTIEWSDEVNDDEQYCASCGRYCPGHGC